MPYPSKPWTNGQQYEIVPGELFEYDATTSSWVHITKATMDSDFQVAKAALEAADSALDTRLTTAEGNITTLQSDVSTIQSQITLLDGMSDSDAARIEANVARINEAYSMIDSDGLAIQTNRSEILGLIEGQDISISTLQTNFNVQSGYIANLENVDSDNSALIAQNTTDIAANTAAIAAVPTPVISATQPAGVTGQLWVNITDGKLYYWNDSDAFVSIVTA